MRYNSKMTEFRDKSLYHYTSFSALNGILRNKEIWLGNVRYMNDRSEMEYFFEKLSEEILCDMPDYSREIRTIFSDQKRRLEGKTAYVFCLSELYDDASQWDRYGNKGKGICIEFSESRLLGMLDNRALLQSVIYSTDIGDHEVKVLIEKYIRDKTLPDGYDSVEAIFDRAWSCAFAFKHPSFNSEREVRICANPFFPDGFSTNIFRYEHSEGSLREFLPLKLCPESGRDYGGCIKRIILGPGSGVDRNLFSRYLQSLMIESNIISVALSTCPIC